MPFYTYILYSTKLDKYYSGSTNDIDRRINDHNSRHTASTRSGIPWELKFVKEFNAKSEAQQHELKIKKMKSRKFIESLIAGQLNSPVARPDL